MPCNAARAARQPLLPAAAARRGWAGWVGCQRRSRTDAPPLPLSAGAWPPRCQVAKGVTQDQIRGIFAPYGEIVDLNVMAPKKDGAMGAHASRQLLRRARSRQLRCTGRASHAAAASHPCMSQRTVSS